MNINKIFKNYIAIINSQPNIENRIKIVNYLTSIIINKLNYNEAIQSLELGESNQSNNKVFRVYEELSKEVDFKIIVFEKVPEVEKPYYLQNGCILKETGVITLEINEVPILLTPWEGSRIISNLFDINENNIFDGLKNSWNILNYYLYPMNFVVCLGANHSQFAAKYKNNGKTIVQRIYDYRKLYSKVYFDGESFKNLATDKSINFERTYNDIVIFYSGVLFELGRIILENDYHDSKISRDYFL